MPCDKTTIDYVVRVVIEPNGTHKWEEGKALASADGSAKTEDLALIIRRLCRVIALHDANNIVRARALDYLHRKGLGGSPLKSNPLN